MDKWFCYQRQYDLLHELGLAVNGVYYMPYKAVELVVCKPLTINVINSQLPKIKRRSNATYKSLT
jgi:hypothetical protein